MKISNTKYPSLLSPHIGFYVGVRGSPERDILSLGAMGWGLVAGANSSQHIAAGDTGGWGGVWGWGGTQGVGIHPTRKQTSDKFTDIRQIH